MLGGCFAVAGAAVLILVGGPLVLMGVIWVAVGLVLLAVGAAGVRRRREDRELARTGKPALATLTDISDTGVTVNQAPRAELTMQVQPEDASAFELKTKRLVSRVNPLRVGATYAIRYDPEHPEYFVFDESAEPAVSVTHAPPITISGSGGDISEQLEAKGLAHEQAEQVEAALRGALGGGAAGPATPADPVDRLEKPGDLKAKGVLTEAEFEAEKAKILRDG